MILSKVKKCFTQVLGVLAAACVVIALGFMSVPQAQATPLPMPSFADLRALHAPYVADSGARLYGWGSNLNGATGFGFTAGNQTTPRQVGLGTEFFSNWIQVSAGITHTLAINNQGQLFAWGDNGQGALGTGQGSGFWAWPQRVGTASNWEYVSAGQHISFAINANGELWAWGATSGSTGGRILGIGEGPGTNVPVRVGTASNWRQVSEGQSRSAAINTNGELFSWGYVGIAPNPDGPGTYTRIHPTPTRVGTASNWRQISVSGFFLALNANGEIFGWGGWQAAGLEPIPGGHTSLEPIRIGTASNWRQISAGCSSLSLAINSNGELFSWGLHYNGRTGLGLTSGGTIVPQRIGNASNWVRAEAGLDSGIALNSSGELFSWGSNASGRTGLGVTAGDTLEPEKVGYALGIGTSRAQRYFAFDFSEDPIELPGDGSATVNLTLTKHLRKPEGTPDPQAEFTFNVVRHAFDDSTTLADRNRLPEVDPITLAPSAVVYPAPAPAGIITRAASTNIFAGIEFTEIGRFTYRVGEIEGSSEINTPPTNSTVVYSLARYEICVFVIVDPDDANELIVDEVVVRRIADREGDPVDILLGSFGPEDDIIFLNTYKRTTTGTNDCPGALSISKEVVGYFADPEASFTFDVTITRTALCPAEPVSGQIMAGSTAVGSPIDFVSGVSTPVALRHGYTLVFDELIVGTRFTATEQVPEGFIPSVVLYVNGEEVTDLPAATLTSLSIGGPHIVGVNRNSAGFTNTHFEPPPTGLVIGNGSFYALFAVAALMTGMLLVLKSRRRIESVPMVSSFHYNAQSGTQRIRTINNTGEGEV